MSEPPPLPRQSGNGNTESGPGITVIVSAVTINFNGLVVDGNASGDLIAYLAGSGRSSATGERVRGHRWGNTGRGTRHATASRGRDQSRASFDHSEISNSQPTIVDPSSFEDAEVGERSDHGAQSSIQSTSSEERLSPPDVSDMENSATASIVEGSATLVNSTPIEEPTAVAEPAILPILQKLDRVSMDHAMGVPLNQEPDAHSSNSSGDRSADYQESGECGGCDNCREEKPKGLISKVEQKFRSLYNKVKGFSPGRLLNLGRQTVPIQRN